MKTGSKEVKSSGEVIGVAEFLIYDSVEEAVSGEGEASCLAFINAQIKTGARNTLRAQLTGKPTKTSLIYKAMSLVDPQEIAACLGDEALIAQLIQRKVNELQADEDADVEEVDGDGDEN